MQHKTRRNVTTIAIAVLFVVAMAVAGLFLISLDTSSPPINSSSVSTSIPPKQDCCVPSTDLKGVWSFKNDKGGTFTADISENTIKVYMSSGSTSMLYWHGTFESYKPVGSVITSTVVDDAAILSKSTSKNFVVGDTTLSFDFTMQGNTKKIDLSRA